MDVTGDQEHTTGDGDGATVGANIRQLRKQRGMSQTALAEAMREAGQSHWYQTTVSRVELGTQGLDLDEAGALEDVLGGGIWAGTQIKIKPQMLNSTALLHASDGLAAEVDELADHLRGALKSLGLVQERVELLQKAAR